MDLGTIYSIIHNFLLTNKLIALGIFLALALFLWKKPWEFLKAAAILAALVFGFYVFSELGNSANFGATKKHDITTERTDKLFGD